MGAYIQFWMAFTVCHPIFFPRQIFKCIVSSLKILIVLSLLNTHVSYIRGTARQNLITRGEGSSLQDYNCQVKKNVLYELLVSTDNVLLSPLYIKLRLVKQFIVSIHYSNASVYLRKKFLNKGRPNCDLVCLGGLKFKS